MGGTVFMAFGFGFGREREERERDGRERRERDKRLRALRPSHGTDVPAVRVMVDGRCFSACLDGGCLEVILGGD